MVRRQAGDRQGQGARAEEAEGRGALIVGRGGEGQAGAVRRIDFRGMVTDTV